MDDVAEYQRSEIVDARVAGALALKIVAIFYVDIINVSLIMTPCVHQPRQK